MVIVNEYRLQALPSQTPMLAHAESPYFIESLNVSVTGLVVGVGIGIGIGVGVGAGVGAGVGVGEDVTVDWGAVGESYAPHASHRRQTPTTANRQIMCSSPTWSNVVGGKTERGRLDHISDPDVSHLKQVSGELPCGNAITQARALFSGSESGTGSC